MNSCNFNTLSCIYRMLSFKIIENRCSFLPYHLGMTQSIPNLPHFSGTNAGICGFWCSTEKVHGSECNDNDNCASGSFFVPQKWASAKLQIPGPSNTFKLNDIDSYTQFFSDPKNHCQNCQTLWNPLKKSSVFFGAFGIPKESETLKTGRFSTDLWFPKILNNN